MERGRIIVGSSGVSREAVSKRDGRLVLSDRKNESEVMETIWSMFIDVSETVPACAGVTSKATEVGVTDNVGRIKKVVSDDAKTSDEDSGGSTK